MGSLPKAPVTAKLGACFTEMYSGSEAGSYSRLVDFRYHSVLGVREIKKKKKKNSGVCLMLADRCYSAGRWN